MGTPLERYGRIPVCPQCGRFEYLESGFVFHAATGKLLRSLWQCSNEMVYEGWRGCGWRGAEPRRIPVRSVGRRDDITGIQVDAFSDAMVSLQKSGDLVLVLHSDGRKEVIL